MPDKIVVHKGRWNVLPVELGVDVSADTFASQIRSQPDQDSQLLMTWTIAFTTDGTDGSLRLTVDDAITADIEVKSGWMDLKRVSGGQPVPVWEKPLEVEFRGSVTV